MVSIHRVPRRLVTGVVVLGLLAWLPASGALAAGDRISSAQQQLM